MQTTSKKIQCPQCGRQIDLVPKAGEPARLIAFCGHGGANFVPVLETDVDVSDKILKSVTSAIAEETGDSNG